MREFIGKVGRGRTLARDLRGGEAEEAMRLILTGKASGEQTAAFLMAMRFKGATVEELTAFARAVKRHSRETRPGLEGSVSMCGAYDGKARTLHLGTLSALIACGAGARVVRHGSRGIPPKKGVGTMDVLEALGVNTSMPPGEALGALEGIGFAFLSTRVFNPDLERLLMLSDSLGVRTVFHTLAPLVNPGNAPAQILGVAHWPFAQKLAEVLRDLGVQRALVFQGIEGADELPLGESLRMVELRGGETETISISLPGLGIDPGMGELRTRLDAEATAGITLAVLRGEERGPVRSAAVLNAALPIYLSGGAAGFEEAVSVAKASLDSGSAYARLRELIRPSPPPGR
jgi:anthranilate phosphoribosyltransferase